MIFMHFAAEEKMRRSRKVSERVKMSGYRQSEASDAKFHMAVRDHWDSIAKPIDGLGIYEEIIARIGGIQRSEAPAVRNRTLLIFLSDNGIVDEGVSQCDSSVTHSVAEAMAADRSTVCIMAREAGVRVYPADVGMKGEKVEGIADRRIRNGTRDFLKEPAMTQEEAELALNTGYEMVKQFKEEGNDIVLLGEMGIGNTTTATAVSCAILGLDPYEVTGRGAGLTDEKLMHKCDVINEALGRYGYDADDAMKILTLFGGYDIAAMAGAVKAGAELNVPVILDGLITLSAALTAERIYKGSSRACIASHMPKEPVGERIMKELSLEAPITAGMALGEGTGAVLLVPQLDVCMALYDKGSRFEGIGVEAYARYK